MRTLLIDCPSPLPFRKLGVLELNVLYIDSFVGLDDFLEGRGLSEVLGLGGTPLLVRVSPLGGCGKELMLTLLRSVFGCGSAAVGAGPDGVKFVVDDGARRPDLGVPGTDLIDDVCVGKFPLLLRVLFTGNAGRAMLGGPTEGRDGRGNVVVIVDRVGSVEKETTRSCRCSQARGRWPGARSY